MKNLVLLKRGVIMEQIITKGIFILLGIGAYKILESALIKGSKNLEYAKKLNNVIWQLAAYVVLWGLSLICMNDEGLIKEWIDEVTLLCTTFLILAMKDEFLNIKKKYKRYVKKRGVR